ncbi:hypothetical protein [Butyrivibrio fibrisolvens]|uniref:hypothetical protein n=1 Tax=Butyrivibrio fibrisolvens TaxID=831 RepID=UPI0004232837|nr:hypothetical protein [Butyrivibrio fibrisolvens]
MKKKIVVFAILFIMLLIWWRVEYKDSVTGFYEQAVEAGEQTFSASISDVRFIVMTNNDPALKDRLDTEDVSVGITIWSDDGEYYDAVSQPLSIHTNGYTSTENTSFEDLPFNLKVGKQYNIAYSAQLQDGTPVDQLSFLLYSDSRSIDVYSFVLILMIALVFALMIFTPWKFEVRFSLVWALMLVLVMIIMPGLMTDRGSDSALADSERVAFANSYAMSNRILGSEKTDDEGYVYIKESGIRNIGYTTYRDPLIRFWLDDNYGNFRSEGQVSYLFKTDDGLHLLSIPSALVVTALRAVSAGYKWIIIGGWLIGAIITLGLALIAMRIAPEHKRFIGFLMCLPSTFMMAMSYSGIGILIGIGLVIFALISKKLEPDHSKVFIWILAGFMAVWALIYTFAHWDLSSTHTFVGAVLGLLKSFDNWLFTIAAYDNESLHEISILPAYLMLGCLCLFSPLCSKWTENMSERKKKVIEAVFIGLSCLMILIRYNQF